MNSKVWKTGLGLAVIFGCSVLAFSAGAALGYVAPQPGSSSQGSSPLGFTVPEIAPRTQERVGSSLDRDELIAPFWEAWDILQEDYVDQPIDEILLMRGAIRGLVDSLGDPHTSYMDPDEFLQANLPLDGEYEGIGAWVDSDAEYLTIISPMPGSPAEEAGLLAGDRVIAVDGEDVIGQDGSVVIRKVLGPAGSTVVLTILREGDSEPFDVSIVRGRIDIPSVEGEMLEGQIGYVRLSSFGNETSDELDRQLRELLAQDPRGLILDLRGNGGGFLNTAVEVSSQFISDGVILIERFGDGQETIYEAEPRGRATDIELVVLIDSGTASASEIVAGAVQDHGRGLLVGVNSFGKGSVQNWVELSDDEGAVRVTIARWYTPDDRLIHGVGLTPDVEVVMPATGQADGQDPQLDKAIELLLGESVTYH